MSPQECFSRFMNCYSSVSRFLYFFASWRSRSRDWSLQLSPLSPEHVAQVQVNDWLPPPLHLCVWFITSPIQLHCCSQSVKGCSATVAVFNTCCVKTARKERIQKNFQVGSLGQYCWLYIQRKWSEQVCRWAGQSQVTGRVEKVWGHLVAWWKNNNWCEGEEESRTGQYNRVRAQITTS